MLIAFAYCEGSQSTHPELCVIPLKPDEFSCMVRIDTLVDTSSAVIRLSPTEGIKVHRNAGEEGIVIEPVTPLSLYLTPSQPDRPGFSVKAVRIVALGERRYELSYKQDAKEGQWRQWRPHEAGA